MYPCVDFCLLGLCIVLLKNPVPFPVQTQECYFDCCKHLFWLIPSKGEVNALDTSAHTITVLGNLWRSFNSSSAGISFFMAAYISLFCELWYSLIGERDLPVNIFMSFFFTLWAPIPFFIPWNSCHLWVVDTFVILFFSNDTKTSKQMYFWMDIFQKEND